ncbi:hypothetical protein [Microbacterium paraoxydans]|uniref:Uncharacterized protein n=1 Tax=Microbacterium paraoxydans TaxID=199592 RepID=A0A1H1L7W5_9MICO|nr:hypothetical protein [Microbacterium paraoxydans]SDR70430.1 hypothetical protein SAMN04489809_0008 [Microbacterium paraoxydans]SDR72363.1 hypothetical protein SAMN04489809_0084 [Microbacterium paraoxydans]
MTITHADIGGDENTARRVLVLARSIAPCIDAFPDDSEQKLDAIAVLSAVVAELPAPGDRRTKSLSRNGTSITFADIESAFDSDARASLRALCDAQGASVPSGSLPAGSFPTERAFERVWPEGGYS